MRSLFFILATCLAGCSSYVAGPCVETGTISDEAAARLATDATHFIAESFAPSQIRLLLPPAGEEQKLSAKLESALRTQGYEIGSYTVQEYAPQSVGRSGNVDLKPRATVKDAEDPNGLRIVYTATVDAERKLFFTLRVGDAWQFTRLYRVLANGVLEAATQPIIRNNLHDL